MCCGWKGRCATFDDPFSFGEYNESNLSSKYYFMSNISHTFHVVRDSETRLSYELI